MNAPRYIPVFFVVLYSLTCVSPALTGEIVISVKDEDLCKVSKEERDSLFHKNGFLKEESRSTSTSFFVKQSKHNTFLLLNCNKLENGSLEFEAADVESGMIVFYDIYKKESEDKIITEELQDVINRINKFDFSNKKSCGTISLRIKYDNNINGISKALFDHLKKKLVADQNISLFTKDMTRKILVLHDDIIASNYDKHRLDLNNLYVPEYRCLVSSEDQKLLHVKIYSQSNGIMIKESRITSVNDVDKLMSYLNAIPNKGRE